MEHQRLSILQLQADTSNLLDRVANLVSDAAALLTATLEPQPKLTEYLDVLRGDRDKVAHLELQMAVVAPMKAGKSTIINALTGTDLLPFRNAAMTAIPTAVVLSRSAREPTMHIADPLREAVARAHDALRAHIERHGIATVEARVAEYQSLPPMIRTIAERQAPVFTSTLVGTDAIHPALIWLNDLNRLASILEPGHTLTRVVPHHMPRISAPWREASALTDIGRGSLVIIDTPGPNEWLPDAMLSDVVKRQIAVCSVVLLVLDYTALNSSAAADLREKVCAAVEVIGRNNLLVVVNRIDQRKTAASDLSPEQVRRFVEAHLGLDDVDGILFETSAAWAFSGARYFRERQRRPGASAPDLREVIEAVLKEVEPIRWRRTIDRLTLDEADEAADDLWRSSGFDPLLKDALERLIDDAGPRCISAALKRASAFLRDVKQTVQLRERALKTHTDVLGEQIATLAGKQAELETSGRELDEAIGDLKKKLRDDLNRLFERDIQGELVVTANDLRGEERGSRRRLALPREMFRRTPKKANVFLFDTLEEAAQFTNDASDHALSALVGVFTRRQRDVLTMIDSARRTLQRVAQRKAGPIVQAATESLRKQFDLHMEIPEYTPSSVEFPSIVFEPQQIDRHIKGAVRTDVRFERRWYTLFLVRHEVTVEIRDPDRTITKYHVDLTKLAAAMTQTTMVTVSAFRAAVGDFVQEELDASLAEYLASLRGIIGDYVANLQSAQEQHKLDIGVRTKLSADLQHIVARCGIEMDACEMYIDLAKPADAGP